MCGGHHRIIDTQGEQCTREAVCYNCDGKHLAAYKRCPRYVERQEVMPIKIEKTISYAEAGKVHRAPLSKWWEG